MKTLDKEDDYTKESNIYNIGLSITITSSIIIGAIINHTYLRSIDALEFFSTSSINDFISLSLCSTIMLSSIILLFSMPYFNGSFFLKENNRSYKYKVIQNLTHRESKFNVLLVFLSLLSLIYIISFYQTPKENNEELNQIQYIFAYAVTIFSTSIFILIFRNWNLYYKTSEILRKKKCNATSIIEFIIYMIAIPNIFLLIWFHISILFGADKAKDALGITQIFLYFASIFFIYLIYPLDKKEIRIKYKVYKVTAFSLMSLFMIGLVSYPFDTYFSENLMKIIGKSDNKYRNYKIDQFDKYGISSGTLCGRVIWRNESYIIILPKNESDIKNRIVIDRKDISPIQGNKKEAECIGY